MSAYDEAQLGRQQVKDQRSDDVKAVLVATIQGGHRLLARIFHKMFPDTFAFLGTTDGWYVFKHPRWIHLGKDTSHIIRLIDEKLHAFVQADSTALINEGNNADPAEVRAVNTMLSDIAYFGFKTMLVNTMQSVYVVMNPGEWLSRLDSRDDILGFEDGLCDFTEKAFREGRPDDMLTLNMGHLTNDVQYSDLYKLAEILSTLAS